MQQRPVHIHIQHWEQNTKRIFSNQRVKCSQYMYITHGRLFQIYSNDGRHRTANWSVCIAIQSCYLQLSVQYHTVRSVGTTPCLKKTSPTFLAITRESIDRFLQYLAEMSLRKQAIICCYIFPPHLINASTLPCETKNTEIVSFHVNAACWFASRHTSHIGIIT